MKSLMLDYAHYNLWVNTRLIEMFKNADDDLISQRVESSFPSIRATLMHLWDVETVWLSRLKGVSPTMFPSTNFTGNNEEVYNKLLSVSTKFVNFVENQPEEYFNQILSFTLLTASGTFNQKAVDMILHCMNHQSFHRGQIITMARQLGFTQFPRTDFIMFKRELV